MHKLIFDLDGTLWETGDGYVYSYNKACQQLNIPEENRKGPEYVHSYLGVKLDELVMTIIPEAPDKQQLGLMLLSNVIEYQLKNPKTCSKDIYSLFENLSKNYELYIISNCPRPFLQAFYEISGVQKFISGDNTIEDSNKKDALKKITKDYSEKAFFIADSTSDYEAIENHQVVQFIYASYGYKKCDFYNLKLNQLDHLPDLLKKTESLVSILKNERYEIIGNGDSFLALILKKDCFYFGFMNIENTDYLDVIIKIMKEKVGDKALYGPIDNNSWYNYRIALNEFDFRLYPDCLSDEAILQKFYDNGFEVCEKYASTVSHVNYDVWHKEKKVKLPSGYEYKIQKGTEECRQYLKAVYDISCDCFKDHSFYEQISYEDFLSLYEKNLSQCSAMLILILYKGQVVAFNFCYPDIEKRFYVGKTFAMDKKFRNPHVLRKMIELTHEEIESQGYDKVLMHFQNQKLKTMQSYFKNNIIRQKEYGVLKYERN